MRLLHISGVRRKLLTNIVKTRLSKENPETRNSPNCFESPFPDPAIKLP